MGPVGAVIIFLLGGVTALGALFLVSFVYVWWVTRKSYLQQTRPGLVFPNIGNSRYVPPAPVLSRKAEETVAFPLVRAGGATTTSAAAGAAGAAAGSALVAEEAEKVDLNNRDQVVRRMRDPVHGLSIRDRSYHMHTYNDCFIASEAVTWLVQLHASLGRRLPREEATHFFNRLQNDRIINHVTNGHSKFEDSYLFYIFTDDKSGATSAPLRPSGGRKILKEGWLDMRVLQIYLHRYIVLYEGALTFAKNADEPPLGAIQLDNATVKVISKRKRECEFEIMNSAERCVYTRSQSTQDKKCGRLVPHSHYCTMRLEDEAEMERWVDALKAASELSGAWILQEVDDSQVNRIRVGEEASHAADSDSDDEDELDEGKLLSELRKASVLMGESLNAMEYLKNAKIKGEDSALRDVIAKSHIVKHSVALKQKGVLQIQAKKDNWEEHMVSLSEHHLLIHKSYKYDLDDVIAMLDLSLVDVRLEQIKERPDSVGIVLTAANTKLWLKASPDGKKLTRLSQSKKNCHLRVSSATDLPDWLAAITLIRAAKLPPPLSATMPLVDPESPWSTAPFLNIMLERYFQDLNDSPFLKDYVQKKVQTGLDSLQIPAYLNRLVVDDVLFGSQCPHVDAVRFAKNSYSGAPDEVVGEMQLSYQGGCGLAISSLFHVNWPRDKSAIIPINIIINMMQFTAKLHVHIPPDKHARCSVFLGELPQDLEFHIDMQISDSSVQLTSLPHLKYYLSHALKQVVLSTIVYPNKVMFFLPYPGRRADLKVDRWETARKRKNTERESARGNERVSKLMQKHLVVQFIDKVINQQNFSFLEDSVSTDVILHGTSPYRREIRGWDDLRDWVRSIHAALRDATMSVVDIGVEGGNVLLRWKLRGTHVGEFWGYPSTGTSLVLSGMTVHTLMDNKIYELWMFWDPASVLAFS